MKRLKTPLQERYEAGRKPNRICKVCGTPFYARPRAINRGWGIYCSLACRTSDPDYRAKKSDASKRRWQKPEERKKMCGVNSKNFGKSLSEKTRLAIGATQRERLKNPELRRILSEATSSKKGPAASHWMGGITPLMQAIRNMPEMQACRDEVLKRDDYRDYFSGIRGGDLHVHHIIPFSCILKKYNITTVEDALNCKELWDIKNMVTMSKINHRAYHEMWGVPTEEQIIGTSISAAMEA